MATASVKEVLPTPLDSTSEPPTLFDGTTRDYKIRLNWFLLTFKTGLLGTKRKFIPKTRYLHWNIIIVSLESLDLLKYLGSNFEGPALLPTDPAKRDFAEELLSYTDTMTKTVFGSLKGDPAKEAANVFDYLENALRKFEDGPFFLGEFSLVDIAYIPYIERCNLFLQDVWKYDLTAGRPKLMAWFQVQK